MLGDGFVVEVPIFVVKVTKAFAYACTFWLLLFLFGIWTCATFCTIRVCFKYCITHFWPFRSIYVSWIVSVVSCWTIQQHPCGWKTWVWTCYNHYIFYFLFIDLFNSCFETVFLKKVTSKYDLFFFFCQKWKPFLVEKWMKNLPSSVWDDQSFRSKLDRLVLFTKNYTSFFLFHYALLFNGCRQNFSVR